MRSGSATTVVCPKSVNKRDQNDPVFCRHGRFPYATENDVSRHQSHHCDLHTQQHHRLEERDYHERNCMQHGSLGSLLQQQSSNHVAYSQGQCSLCVCVDQGLKKEVNIFGSEVKRIDSISINIIRFLFIIPSNIIHF